MIFSRRDDYSCQNDLSPVFLPISLWKRAYVQSMGQDRKKCLESSSKRYVWLKPADQRIIKSRVNSKGPDSAPNSYWEKSQATCIVSVKLI